MTSAPARPRLVELDARDLADRLAEALHVYVAAMGYPPGTARQRRSLWLDHVRRPGWRAVGWLDPAGPLLGIAYGYTGGPGQWWYEEVRRGVRPRDTAMTDDYFELTELHVRPDAQGGGLGEGLLRALLAGHGPGPRAAVDPRARPAATRAGLAALPPAGLPRRAARSPLHRRRPPVRRARPQAAAAAARRAAPSRSALPTGRSRTGSGARCGAVGAPAGTWRRAVPAARRPSGTPPGPSVPAARQPRTGPRPRPGARPAGRVHRAERLRPRPGRAGRAARRHRQRRDRGRDPGDRPGRPGARDQRAGGDRRRRRRLRLPPGGLHRVAAALLRPDVRPARPAVGRRGTGRGAGAVLAAPGRQPAAREREGRPDDRAGRQGRLPAQDHHVRRGAGDQRRRRRRHGELDVRRGQGRRRQRGDRGRRPERPVRRRAGRCSRRRSSPSPAPRWCCWPTAPATRRSARSPDRPAGHREPGSGPGLSPEAPPGTSAPGGAPARPSPSSGSACRSAAPARPRPAAGRTAPR